MKYKALCILLGLSLLLNASACGQEQPAQTTPVSNQSSTTTVKQPIKEIRPTVIPQETCLYLFEGDSYDLRYIVDDSESTTDKIVWASSSDCVTVENGIVTAQTEGYAYISANAGAQTLIRVLPLELPILSVDTDGMKIDSREDYTPCVIGVNSTNDQFSFEAASAGIRIRGNSTSGYAKKPYRIQFDTKQNLLGLNSGAECRSWVLLAEAIDDSMIRNSTSLTMASKLLNEYSSDWRYVSLEINGEYQGVYLLCEQSQINKHRVDIEEAGVDTDELQSGYLFEVDASGPHDNTFKIYYDELYITNFLGEEYTRTSNDSGQRLLYITLKNNDYTEEQFAFAKKHLRNVFQIIYSATYEEISYVFDENFDLTEAPDLSAQEAISNVVDIDSMVRMYLLSEIMCNHDDYKKSFYLWVDFSEDGNGKLTFGCPWDFDGAIVSWNTYDYRPTDQFFAAKRNLWYVMMMNHDWFRSKVEACWQTQYACNGAFEATIEMIGKITANYSEDFQKDAELWSRQQDQQTHAELSQDWLRDRIAWLDSQFGALGEQHDQGNLRVG